MECDENRTCNAAWTWSVCLSGPLAPLKQVGFAESVYRPELHQKRSTRKDARLLCPLHGAGVQPQSAGAL